MPRIPDTQETEMGGLRFEVNSRGKKLDPISKNNLGVVVYFCNTKMQAEKEGGLWSKARERQKLKILSEK
jgi:hypothetical protein